MEINYEDSWVYSAYDDGYLIANGNIVQHDGEQGGSSASSSVSTSIAWNTDYVMQSNYWVEFDSFGNEGFWDPAGYSLIGGGFWGDSMDVYGSPDNELYTFEASAYVGSTCVEQNSGSQAPQISGTDETTYGSGERGTSGYFIIYGSGLATGGTSVSIDSGISTTITYAADDQVNVYYSIPEDTDSGSGTKSHTLTLTTGVGFTTTPFAVYDPTPSISSISPSTWQAGTANHSRNIGYWVRLKPSRFVQ